MQLKADKVDGGWNLNGQKIFTTSAHFANWYWVGARTDQNVKKHAGITLFLIPMDHPGMTIQGMPTIGDELTNQVFFDDVFVGDDYVVGELNRGFQYISEALDLERFTMFTYSPVGQRVDEIIEYVREERRDGKPLREDPVIRTKVAQLVTQLEVARVLGLKVVATSMMGDKPPTVEASEYKLYTTELSQRIADTALDITGPGGQLRVHNPEAPMRGRAELTFRYTVIDTVGGGASEIQKNIISRRKLGLPKNF
jgi:alkylation response protein AidB-like acyl-CoA dehydrogenase